MVGRKERETKTERRKSYKPSLAGPHLENVMAARPLGRSTQTNAPRKLELPSTSGRRVVHGIVMKAYIKAIDCSWLSWVGRGRFASRAANLFSSSEVSSAERSPSQKEVGRVVKR